MNGQCNISNDISMASGVSSVKLTRKMRVATGLNHSLERQRVSYRGTFVVIPAGSTDVDFGRHDRFVPVLRL